MFDELDNKSNAQRTTADHKIKSTRNIWSHPDEAPQEAITRADIKNNANDTEENNYDTWIKEESDEGTKEINNEDLELIHEFLEVQESFTCHINVIWIKRKSPPYTMH